MNVYLENGYINMDAILDSDTVFWFIVGGRAIGKTYGALNSTRQRGLFVMYLRRTQTQCDLISKPEMSPYKSINKDFGTDITIKPITKYNGGIYDGDNIIGYTGALSTISNMRSFDASNVDVIIYDEFIPERHERPIKAEASALWNAYETISRNRELKGLAPTKLLCLANANDLGNQIFIDLGLVDRADRMRATGEQLFIDKARSLAVFMPTDSPISAAKADTSLYKLTRGTDFSDVAIENDFTGIDRENIKSRALNDYKPVALLGELCIYRHRRRRDYYISRHKSGSPEVFPMTEAGKKRFLHAHGDIYRAYLTNSIHYESALCEVIISRVLGI